MKIFSNKNHKNFIVIGCGRLGAKIANTLYDEGKHVIVIDKNKEAFQKLSSSFGGMTIDGDAMDLTVLSKAVNDENTCVIVVTDRDNVNIIVSKLLMEIFDVKHIISRLYDPDRQCVYQELNIETICPTLLVADEIQELLQQKDIRYSV